MTFSTKKSSPLPTTSGGSEKTWEEFNGRFQHLKAAKKTHVISRDGMLNKIMAIQRKTDSWTLMWCLTFRSLHSCCDQPEDMLANWVETSDSWETSLNYKSFCKGSYQSIRQGNHMVSILLYHSLLLNRRFFTLGCGYLVCWMCSPYCVHFVNGSIWILLLLKDFCSYLLVVHTKTL